MCIIMETENNVGVAVQPLAQVPAWSTMRPRIARIKV